MLPELSPSLRALEAANALSVFELLNRTAALHAVAFAFTSAEHLAHVLLPRAGLVHTLVAVDSDGEVTDLVAFYFLANRILARNPLQGEELAAAYLYFFAAGELEPEELVAAAAHSARNTGAAVFNALPISDASESGLRDLGFGMGDGTLQYFAHGLSLPGPIEDADLFLFSAL